jgi:hypothetical protein
LGPSVVAFSVGYFVFGGMFVVMLVQAIVTLEQYGWTEKETDRE